MNIKENLNKNDTKSGLYFDKKVCQKILIKCLMMMTMNQKKIIWVSVCVTFLFLLTNIWDDIVTHMFAFEFKKSVFFFDKM